jgi:nucleotide-binding universal stress UspA family protein
MLLDRNYDGLWVVADGNDLALFKASVPGLLPMGEPSRWKHAVTVLFVTSRMREKTPVGTVADCLAWVQGLSASAGGPLARVTAVEQLVDGKWDRAVQAELERHDHGMLLIGRNRDQPWRERLLYVLRHKIIGLMGGNDNLGNVAVFLDFSDASLLALAFVRRVFMSRPDVRITFIHAHDSRVTGVDPQWSRLKRVVGLKPDELLTRIGSGETPGAAIVKEATSGRYGIIVMGKRGLTGIKRLMLGSVSTAVLGKLDSQTLFLVD